MTTVISALRESFFTYLKKTFSFYTMIAVLVRRDLKIKYAQTFLGIFWAIIQPLTGLLIFTVFFDKLIKLNIPGVPYPLFAFTGMVSWFFFSNIVSGAGMSLLQSQQIIKKIYFPRLSLLIAKVAVAFVDFFISLLLLLILMFIIRQQLHWQFLLLPVIIIFNIICGLSIAVWLSALTVKYRDLQHIIPYIINFGIWLTPVFYPETIIPPGFKFLIFINPMAAAIAAFRWCIIGGKIPEAGYLLSLIPAFFLLISGIYYFRKIEGEVSDHI